MKKHGEVTRRSGGGAVAEDELDEGLGPARGGRETRVRAYMRLQTDGDGGEHFSSELELRRRARATQHCSTETMECSVGGDDGQWSSATSIAPGVNCSSAVSAWVRAKGVHKRVEKSGASARETLACLGA